MACDKCDPKEIYRYDGVEKSIIPIPAIQLGRNDTVSWDVQRCKFCHQQYDIPTINKPSDGILSKE